MVAGLVLDLLVILAGSMGMLWLLQGLFGSRTTIAPYGEPFHDGESAVSAPEVQDEVREPFIPMPDHLKSHAEMVAWMTQELPRLTEAAATKPNGH